MLARCIKIPNRSFFLFGPRATGKTSWIRSQFPQAHNYNLLSHQELTRLSRDLSQFSKEVLSLPKDAWVFVDEIQKLPELLDEVHELLSQQQCNFILTGSSARKLKMKGANLLAGRVIRKDFFTIVSKELEFNLDIERHLKYGMLPDILNFPHEAIEILNTYTGTYIKEEILQEGFIKNLPSFSRFLEIAALVNGQILNIANVARESQVARQTVDGYFNILVDTLVATKVPAFQPKLKVREHANAKFYFFDTGIVRSLTGRLHDALRPEDKGFLFETFILNELRAYTSYSGIGGEIMYWRAGSKEIDFVWKRGDEKVVTIEVKATERWRPEFSEQAALLKDLGATDKAHAVYLGDRTFLDKGVEISPVINFCKLLWAGKILY